MSSSYTFSTALKGRHQGSPSEGQIGPYLELLNYQGKLPSMFEFLLPMDCCLYFSRTKKVDESIYRKVELISSNMARNFSHCISNLLSFPGLSHRCLVNVHFLGETRVVVDLRH